MAYRFYCYKQNPYEIWSLCVFGARSHLVHRAAVLLRVSTVVAFCAALIGGGAVLF